MSARRRVSRQRPWWDSDLVNFVGAVVAGVTFAALLMRAVERFLQ